MQVVLAIVACQLILLAMKGKLTLLDAVTVTTDEDAQERLRRVDDILDVVVTLNEVGISIIK